MARLDIPVDDQTARSVKMSADAAGQSISEFVRRRVLVGREAAPYPFTGPISGPSFVRDLAAVQGWTSGESVEIDAAFDRLKKFERWSEDNPIMFAPQTTSTAAQIFPTGYKTPVSLPMNADRPLASATETVPINGSNPFTVPRHTSGGTVDPARAEGAQPAEVDLVFGVTTVVPKGLSGMLNLTRELVDSASPGGDLIALSLMREDWYRQAEILIYTELNGANGAGGTITAGFVPSGAQARVSTTPATNLLIDLKKAVLEYGNVRRRKARNVVAGAAALTHLGGLLGAEANSGDDTALARIFGARLNPAVNDYATGTTDMRVTILGSDESCRSSHRWPSSGSTSRPVPRWSGVRCGATSRSSWRVLAACRPSGSRRPEEEQMPKKIILIGDENMRSPSAATPEAAAEEYVHNRATFGNYAPKPPIERWQEDQRKRFEAEMRRLEEQRVRQTAEAVEFAGRREL